METEIILDSTMLESPIIDFLVYEDDILSDFVIDFNVDFLIQSESTIPGLNYSVSGDNTFVDVYGSFGDQYSSIGGILVAWSN